MIPLIELQHLHCVFKKPMGLFRKEQQTHVLKDISLSIQAGEILAVVGESGCGKTTLGKIITGLIRPSAGEIRFEGKPLFGFLNNENSEFRRSVQFIQQDSYAALNPVRTIYQSLVAPLKRHYTQYTVLQLDNRLEELMTMVGLVPADQFLTKYPHQLSGGQRQRVLMARALSLNPKLIVADEPVSMIDVSLRLSILNLMTELNQKLNIAFVYITHDLATAKYIADQQRIAVMYLGEIVEVGAIESVLNNPRHPYTQALLTAVPIPDPTLAQLQREIPITSMDLPRIDQRADGCPFASRCPYVTPDCRQGTIALTEFKQQHVRCIHESEVPQWNVNPISGSSDSR